MMASSLVEDVTLYGADSKNGFVTIFDVDIDSFEEKPWRHPGVDISDFFNFGFNEESWKQYCKQLEQLRLEATMQTKIRVYESGRTEQEYDPDLPPELAAAVGIHDVSAENGNLGRADVGPSDLAKASARVRPPIPTGRAIQVEGGCGERLPSVDTRPPRVRDSDAIIEITLQGSLDDDSPTGNGAPEPPDNDLPREDLRVGNEVEDDAAQEDTEYFDSFSTTYSGRNRELVGRSAPFMNSLRDDMPGGDGILPFPPEAPVQYRPGSRGQDPVHPGGNFGTPHEDRYEIHLDRCYI
ncbi:FIP1[V]-like protein [Vitis vinifera]|uniref:FIP1[V]-like protein n=1 Tax=Vitis vinifera TaxID=29760 RepID=A0A438IHG8_VITVI|nr:FIP1[V]-like protein [Vitis vinifera]